MMAGKGYLQPDKAGSFGAELITLYKITGNTRYLDAATKIADTLAAKVVPGDADHSPWPFRVHAQTGELPSKAFGTYTSNWTPTLRLFEDLIALKQGEADKYRKAHEMAIMWLKKYPMKSNKWGPFFEDCAPWSNTEINADTVAMYILEHPESDPRLAARRPRNPRLDPDRVWQTRVGYNMGSRQSTSNCGTNFQATATPRATHRWNCSTASEPAMPRIWTLPFDN